MPTGRLRGNFKCNLKGGFDCNVKGNVNDNRKGKFRNVCVKGNSKCNKMQFEM